MSRKVLISEIGYLTEIIGEQYVTINGHDNRIPRIELDLMMENVRRLYDCLYHLNKINDKAGPADENTGEMKHQGLEADEPEASVETVPEEIPEIRESKTEEPEIMGSEEEKSEQAAEDIPEEDLVEITPSHAIREEKKYKPADNSITLDLFTAPATVADKFREKTPVMATRIQNHKISDLKAAIGINDKFLFINDLFDGNMKAYSIAIDTLNGMGSFQEAETYIERVKTDGNRVRNLETIARLTELVKRKFL